MATLLFFPNDHILAWVYHAPGLAPAAAVDTVQNGLWPFPPDWRLKLEDQFFIPERLELHARRHGEMVVVFPETPLKERVPGRLVSLTPGQTQVIVMVAQGLTTGQIAAKLHMRRRSVMYRVAEVKRRLGAITRAEAVERRYKDTGEN